MADISVSLGNDGMMMVTREVVQPSAAVRLMAACLLASSSVVHLVMVPAHAGEWFAEGIGFAVAGWLQLLLALAVAVRCRRWVLWATVLTNLVILSVWLVSRTSGFPFGPNAHQAESMRLVDLFTASVEFGTVLLALGLFVSRHEEGDARSAHRSIAALGPLVVVGLTTAILTSPGARSHAHDTHTFAETGFGAGAAAAPDGHHHETPIAASRPPTAVAVEPGHDHAHANDPAASAGSPTAADDKGFSLLMNGHQHTHVDEPMDGPTTALLAHQLARTAELVALYPDVAAAEAAGYRRNGPYAPGLGTHYGKGGGTIVGAEIDEQNVLDPMLIFDGSDPDSKLVGFMYIAFGSAAAPQGFAGPNDIWHYHTNVCVVIRPDGSIDAPLGADAENVDKALCDRYGGFVIDNTGYMLHVWTVPGYENPLGVFHETHPGLPCADGTYYTKTREELGTSLSMCHDTP